MQRFTLLILSFILLTGAAVNAQFKKGQLMPGITVGSIFFNSGKTEYSAPPPTTGYTSNTNSAGINLSPSLGWFISGRTVIGGRVSGNYRYDKYLDASNNVTFRKKEDRVTQWGLGAFVRNYFGQAGRFIPFGQVAVDGGLGNARTEGFTYTSTYRETYKGKSGSSSFINAGVSAGVTRLLGEQVGLDLAIGYVFSHTQQKFTTDTFRDVGIDGTIDETRKSEITTRMNNHGVTLSMGIQVFIGRK
jgi:hypothetical protein